MKIKLVNYKSIDRFEAELTPGNLYFIKGKNGTGKTSLIQAMKELFEVRTINKNKLKKGEKEGYVEGEFVLADGVTYILRMEYQEGKEDKFTIFLPSGITEKRKEIIRYILKYNSFSADEFFNWGLTAEGRRKQRDVLLDLLPDEKKKKFLELQEELKYPNGKLMKERRDVNAKVSAIEKMITANKVSPEELEVAKKKDEWEKAIKEEEEEVQKLYEKYVKEKGLIDSKKEMNDRLQSMINEGRMLIGERDKFVEETKAEIKRLQELLEVRGKEYEEKIQKKRNEAVALKKKIDMIPEAVSEKEYNERKEKLKNNKEAFEKVSQIIGKVEQFKTLEEELKKYRETQEKLNKTIEEKRALSKSIVKDGIDMEELVVEGDELLYNDGEKLLPFNENNISYSDGVITIFKMMKKINKNLPLWLIGKAAELDENKIELLRKEAESGIIIADLVTKDDDLKIEIEYED